MAISFKGDPTEIALQETAAAENILPSSWPRLSEIAFDAGRKLMTTFHPYKGKVISFTKGRPDILLEKCNDIEHTTFESTG